MYCPNCGKELKVDSVKFCPECGKSLSNTDISQNASDLQHAQDEHTSKVKLRTAMFAICIIFAAVSIGLTVFAMMDEGPMGYDGDLHYWFDEEGGMFVCIGMFLVSVITGIIGLCSKD